jgi:hypothetical protein
MGMRGWAVLAENKAKGWGKRMCKEGTHVRIFSVFLSVI